MQSSIQSVQSTVQYRVYRVQCSTECAEQYRVYRAVQSVYRIVPYIFLRSKIFTFSYFASWTGLPTKMFLRQPERGSRSKDERLAALEATMSYLFR